MKVHAGGSPSCVRTAVERDDHVTRFERLRRNVEARVANTKVARAREREAVEMRDQAIRDCYAPFAQLE